MLNKLLPFQLDENSNLDKYILAMKKSLRLGFSFGFISNLLMLSLPIFSMQVLDRVLNSGSIQTLVMLALIVIMCLIGLVLIQLARSKAYANLGEWLEQQISPIIFNTAIKQAASSKKIGGSQAVLDFNTIKSFISGTGVTTILDAPWSLLFVVILFMIHPINGIITIAGAGALLVSAIYMDRSTKVMIEQSNEKLNRSRYLIDSASRNAEVMVAMSITSDACSRWQSQALDARAEHLKAIEKTHNFQSFSKFLRFIIQVAVTAFGGYLVVRGSLTSGEMIAGSILVSRALAPFEALIASWRNLTLSRKAYARLKTMLAYKHDDTGIKTVLPQPRGELAVAGLYYAPPQSKEPILKNISFKLEAGTILGVIGSSAAGKSTLARIITGIWKPIAGNATLDGVDIYNWIQTDNEYSGGVHFGYLPQDVELFSGTIKENIARLKQNVDDAAVIKAAKIAGVHELIIKLPQGYDTKIGFDGLTLSGGQRQRVALARAFFGDPKLVVLDEPNASLDQNGEQALSQAIRHAKDQGITCVVISHRPTILDVVDKVMIMSNGMVMAYGDRDEVIKRNIAMKPKAAVVPLTNKTVK